MVVEPVKPVPAPAKPKPIPPVVQEKKAPEQAAVAVLKPDSLPPVAVVFKPISPPPAPVVSKPLCLRPVSVFSKPDSLPPVAVDTPRKAMPEPTLFSVPLGGTVSMHAADSLSRLKPDTAIRVMPGPGFVQDSSPTFSRITLDEPKLPPQNEIIGCTFIDTRRQLLDASSALQLGKGGWEFKWYNQLYTQTSFFDSEGKAVEQSQRSSYLSSILNVSYGLGPRVNVGVDAWLQSVALTPRESSPFALLGFPSGPDSRTALTAIGPRIRVSPARKWHGLVQSSFLFPVAQDPEGRNNGKPYLATENFIWWTQAYQNFPIGNRFQLYGELGAYWSVPHRGPGHFAMPATAIFSWFPKNKVSLMALAQFWPGLGGRPFSFWWAQTGLGSKIALSDSFLIELMYGRFIAGKLSAGKANTFNLGLRYVIW